MKVTLYEGLEDLGQYCFKETALGEIVIPKSIIYIGERAFSSCSELTKVVFARNSELEIFEEDVFDGVNEDL